ncbi:hypothetical protein DL771_006469 [Monosporascus sp. 5C6A]|nr:hypothetical protein DL771_006469 [Monosporascus sp. 5C6A]
MASLVPPPLHTPNPPTANEGNDSSDDGKGGSTPAGPIAGGVVCAPEFYAASPTPTSPGHAASSSGGYLNPAPPQSSSMTNSVYGGQPSPPGAYEELYKPPPGSEGASPYPQLEQPGSPHPYPQTQRRSGSPQDRYDAYRYSGVPPPPEQITEVLAVNPLGMGNNRAEPG